MSEDFGTRLKQVMDEHNVTAVAVARAIGCSAQAVSKWLKGGNVEYNNLRGLAEYLQVDWIWLRYGDEAIKERVLAHDEADFIRHIRADTVRRLMENEERLSLVIDAARLGIWDWDIFTNEFRWSPEMTDLFGLGRQTLTTTPEGLLARIHPEDVGHFLRRAREAYNSASELHYEFRIVRTDGEIRWVLCAGRYYKDRFDKVVRSLGMMMDVTDRKAREAEKAAASFDTTTALVLVLDPEGRLADCNEVALRALSLDWPAMRGRQLSDLGLEMRDIETQETASLPLNSHRLTTARWRTRVSDREVQWSLHSLRGISQNINSILALGVFVPTDQPRLQSGTPRAKSAQRQSS